MIARSILLMLLLLNSSAVLQKGHRDPTPLDRDANSDRPVFVQKIDAAQVRREADELAQLADSIPASVDQASNGVLVKDLKDRLKRIEKLSKELRGHLLLD